MNRILFIALLMLTSCHIRQNQQDHRFYGNGRYIENVPFFPQEEYYCGPSTMASVLNYWGYKISMEDVADKVFTPKLKGSVTLDMLSYARKKGFEASSYGGSVYNIKAEINKGHPLILYIDLGSPPFLMGHYVVVVGYHDGKEGIIAYSGKDKDVIIPYKQLMKSWGKTGFWTLLIVPEDKDAVGKQPR